MFPDANPIENVWSYIKMKLKGKSIYTLKHFIPNLKNVAFFTN